MKEEINLLPPAVWTARRHRLYLDRFRHLFWSVVIACLLIGCVYVGIIGALWHAESNLAAQLSHGDDRSADVRTRINNINQLLGAVDQQANLYTPWTDHLSDILKAAPADATLNQIRLLPSLAAVGQVKTVLSVTGQASSRTTIIDYEHKLETLPWVQHVEAPLANLASGPALSFTFTITRNDNHQAP